MMKMMTIAIVLGALGCAPATVGSAITIPTDAAQTCARQCSEIGLGLDSVVVMANTVGCVCRAQGPASPPVPPPPGAGAAGGMAAIMLQAAARRSATSTTSSSPTPSSQPPPR